MSLAWQQGLEGRVVLVSGAGRGIGRAVALAFAAAARARAWAFALPHFRGCSGELNLAPRAYHSGDFEEVGWMLGRLRARCRRWAASECALCRTACTRRPRRPRGSLLRH